MKRNYKQLCPIAYTLDIIGERWTLLIIRELLYGERRFSDLLRALHGIGANLLSNRLKELEQKELITRKNLPPPAATHVYGLTERGKGLKSILQELALWGLPYLKFPFAEDCKLSVVSTMAALEGVFFNASAAKGISLTCEVHAEGEVFCVAAQKGELEIAFGFAKEANLVIEVGPRCLLELCAGIIELEKAVEGKGIIIHSGTVLDMRTMLNMFSQ